MSDKVRRSVHLTESQDRAIQDLLRTSRQDRQVPEFDSKAEVIRSLLSHALEESELAELVSEERRILALRDEFVQNEARLNSLRTGFEKRAREEIRKRFESGMQPEQIREYGENYHREVDILYPEWGSEDHEDRREALHRYVEELVTEACAAQDSESGEEFDPMDPEFFRQYGSSDEEGVSPDRDLEETSVLEEATQAAREWLERDPQQSHRSLVRKLETRGGYADYIAANAASKSMQEHSETDEAEVPADD